MITKTSARWFALLSVSYLLPAVRLAAETPATPPKVGDPAPTFTLKTLTGQPVALAALTAKQPVVLVLLRGWPGYQCPICTKQVHQYVTEAAGFTGKAQVLMVYPGPADKLKAHAEEFLHDKQWPKEFLLVTDPDYTFTKAYGLRWDAPAETAYPATFILDTTGKVRFAHISHSHGDRTRAAEVLKALDHIK